MAISHAYSNSWVNPFCESCLKNSHEKHKVSLKRVVSTNDETKYSDLHVCGKCGSTSKL